MDMDSVPDQINVLKNFKFYGDNESRDEILDGTFKVT